MKFSCQQVSGDRREPGDVPRVHPTCSAGQHAGLHPGSHPELLSNSSPEAGLEDDKVFGHCGFGDHGEGTEDSTGDTEIYNSSKRLCMSLSQPADIDHGDDDNDVLHGQLCKLFLFTF